MPLSRMIPAAALGCLMLAAGLPAQAATKEPPACAAISFRTVAPGLPDGEQDAGLYKSRFVKIELKASVKNGEAGDYYMLINGKRPDPLDGGVPKSAEGCLKSKHVAVPVKPQNGGSCAGARFRVVIDRSSGQKIAMLFGLQGDDWHLCSAAKI